MPFQSIESVLAATQGIGRRRASVISLFCSGLSWFGNSMLNWMIRFPFVLGSLEMGIPSPGTIF